MKLSFSLAKPTKPIGSAPPLKQPTAFSALDDDDTNDKTGHNEEDGFGSIESHNKKKNKGNVKLVSQHAVTSKVIQKRMEAEKKVDQTVYEYDEVWDKMQEAKQRAKEAKEVDSTLRKPKYIKGLLETAETRRLDHLRAEEAMMQKEREREGDEFADKETFVTQAYKDQMAEVRQAEEEERKREETQKKKGGFSAGMTHFYAKLLQDSSQTHDATMAATQKIIGPTPPTDHPSSATASSSTVIPPATNLTITKPPTASSSTSSNPTSNDNADDSNSVRKTDLELARAAQAEGKEVELNDDNQLVDKRELLSAGLNLSAPNTRHLGGRGRGKASNSNDAGAGEDAVNAHRAAGTAASRKEINARRAREMRDQMVDEEERLKREEQRREREARERVVAKRNNEDDIQSARERYLARKRQKVMEEGAGDGAT